MQNNAIPQALCIYYICKKILICMTERVLTKGFKHSLSFGLCLTSRCKSWLLDLEHVIFDSCQTRVGVGDIEQAQW